MSVSTAAKTREQLPETCASCQDLKVLAKTICLNGKNIPLCLSKNVSHWNKLHVLCQFDYFWRKQSKFFECDVLFVKFFLCLKTRIKVAWSQFLWDSCLSYIISFICIDKQLKDHSFEYLLLYGGHDYFYVTLYDFLTKSSLIEGAGHDKKLSQNLTKLSLSKPLKRTLSNFFFTFQKLDI